MESIDALAKAVNEYEGGLVLVSHDMRLISQVAEEIWVVDNGTVSRYDGNIANFKMEMRAQMGIDGDVKQKLKGDASVAKKDDGKSDNPPKKAAQKKTIDVVPPPRRTPKDDDSATAATSTTASSFDTEQMRGSLPSSSNDSVPVRKAYIPPHLRNK